MSGTGMKQARQIVGGAKRRGGAKPRGRNVTDGLGTIGGKWLPTIGKTLKGTKPREKRDAAVNRTSVFRAAATSRGVAMVTL
jgi:hypothetical protein